MLQPPYGIWNFYLRPSAVELTSKEKAATDLPEKPAIAVLPFDNLSGDADQEYLADGITENIITALSKIPEMLVIARNSVFTDKDKPIQSSYWLWERFVTAMDSVKDKPIIAATSPSHPQLTAP